MGDKGPGRLVGQLHPFQVEEDEVLVDRGALLARVGQERTVLGVVRLGRVQQAGVDRRPVHLLVETFQLRQGAQQDVRRRAAVAGDLAAVARLEGPGTLQGVRQVGWERGILDALVEVTQFPPDAIGATGWRSHGVSPFQGEREAWVREACRRLSSRKRCQTKPRKRLEQWAHRKGRRPTIMSGFSYHRRCSRCALGQKQFRQ